MEKKLILALVLSILILSVYSRFIEKYSPVTQPVRTPIQQDQASQQQSQLKAPPSPVTLPSIEPVAFEPVELSNQKIQFVLSSPGASVVEVNLKEYLDDQTKKPASLISASDATNGALLFIGSDYMTQAFKTGTINKLGNAIMQSFESGGLYFKKSISLVNNSYFSELEATMDNKSDHIWNESLEMVALSYPVKANSINARFDQIIIQNSVKPIKITPNKIKQETTLFSGSINWIGLKQRYFSFIIKPNFSIDSVKAYRKNDIIHIVLLTKFSLSPGERLIQKSDLYSGPNILNYLKYKELGIEKILDMGVIEASLLYILHFFYNLTHTWGLSIIILSALIYFLFLPLTAKSMSSMKKMQALAPKIEELRKTYKDNPQKMNKEVMELYKKNKVNPLGGCLPMLIQLPIFFALYQTLMRSVELKGSSFLWIKDLSLPDRAFILPMSLPVIGDEINALPLLMGIAMFFQQKLSSFSGAKIQAEQQRMMNIMMPILFCFIFYKFPSGLVLYWLTNTCLMLSYYYQIRHKHLVQE